MSSHIIEFECWSCKETVTVDLQQIQEDRLEIEYQEIRPNPENPQRAHVRCPECGKFNTVKV